MIHVGGGGRREEQTHQYTREGDQKGEGEMLMVRGRTGGPQVFFESFSTRATALGSSSERSLLDDLGDPQPHQQLHPSSLLAIVTTCRDARKQP